MQKMFLIIKNFNKKQKYLFKTKKILFTQIKILKTSIFRINLFIYKKKPTEKSMQTN